MRRTDRTGSTLWRGLLVSAVAVTGIFVAGPLPSEAADLIPDEGLPPAPIAASPLVSRRTQVLQAGVVGSNEQNDTFPGTDLTVAAIAEIGDTIYVGGKFTEVEIAATGQRNDQRFLAAFDRTTGAWIDTFRPTINGNVWDLKATDDGRLIVGGQFTSVNGEANTTGVVMLDAATGAVDPNWRVTLTLTGSTRWPIARTLDIEDGKVYIGGNFTRIAGTNGVTTSVGQAARVDLNTGNVDRTFLPNFDGIVFDIDADADRVYAVGNFLYVNGIWSIGLGVLHASDGELVTGLEPWVRTSINNTSRSYQQAVLALDDQIWQTGSEHNRQAYQPSDYSLIRSWVSHPYGDGQALATLNGIVYTGSHANGNTSLYQDAYRWPGLDGATSSKPIRWMAAFDTATPEHLTWYPGIGSEKGEGSWELFVDSTDCLWTGGDFNRGSYDGDTPRYVQGFAKFCAADSTPPEPPTSPLATARNSGVDLSWTGSVDDRGGQVRYELLKNDSVFASYIGITTFRDPDGTATDRYFVRAMDETGNRSATTRVFTASDVDTTRPSIPEDLVGVIEANGDVTLTWTPSTDNVGVTGYIVYRNSVEIATVTDPTYVVPAPAEGDHWYQVRAFDAAGNLGFKNQPVKVTIIGVDTSPPRTPQDLAGVIEANGDVTLTWTPSTDNVGVVDYIVYRNGVEIAIVTDPTHVVPAPPEGDHYYQVRARDDAGNESFKTPSILITIAPDPATDVENPRTPQDLAGVIEANGDVTLTWTPSTDNVGVTGYIVYRNSVEIATVTDPTYVVPTPAPGDHWYQVRAFDAAGNESFKTPSILITIAPDPASDTSPPRTPQDLAGVIEANGDVTLTWTPSTDNIGVADYIVYRNSVEIATVTDPTYVVPTPAPGDHYYQVRARDAAGNESFKTPSIRITIAPDPANDVENPRTPQDLAAVIEANGDVTLTWTPSTDNIGVADYIVYRNSVEIATVTDPTYVVPTPAPGDHYYQVRARDAAGNESFKTPSILITIAPDPANDVENPRTPQDLAAVIEANGDVTLTWTASTDNIGVVGYIVYRNSVEIDTVASTTATIPAPAPGSHFYQVRAFDAAGNQSFKTPSTRVDI